MKKLNTKKFQTYIIHFQLTIEEIKNTIRNFRKTICYYRRQRDSSESLLLVITHVKLQNNKNIYLQTRVLNRK